MVFALLPSNVLADEYDFIVQPDASIYEVVDIPDYDYILNATESISYDYDFVEDEHVVEEDIFDEDFYPIDINPMSMSELRTGTVGTGGAQWQLYGGVLTVDSGFIQSTGSSPWLAHRNYIHTIVFTGPITAGANLSGLFNGLWGVRTIEGLTYFDTSNVTTMRNMFRSMDAVTSLDLTSFDTRNVTSMYCMFRSTGNLVTIEFSPNFVTHNVRYMNEMFAGANSLVRLDLSNFDTRNVRHMPAMFMNATSLETLELSPNFVTHYVTDMRNMFRGTARLTSLDLSSFDTSNVRNMYSMFNGARSLTSLDVSHFDTSNVGDMSIMFGVTSNLVSLDLSNFDTSNVTAMNNMFSQATSLRELTLGENFSFIGTPALPGVRANAQYTGRWVNVANGTIEQPRGTHVLTSAQLMETYDGSTMADTWVWQRVAPIADPPFINEITFSADSVSPVEWYDGGTLPNGFVLDSSTGTVSGNLEPNETLTFTITVYNDDGYDTWEVTVTRR